MAITSLDLAEVVCDHSTVVDVIRSFKNQEEFEKFRAEQGVAYNITRAGWEKIKEGYQSSMVLSIDAGRIAEVEELFELAEEPEPEKDKDDKEKNNKKPKK